MAKKIIWSESAVTDRFKIYSFWLDHNRSNFYSEKLERLFNKSVKLITLYPEIGTQTDFAEVQVKIIRNYKLFYRNNSEAIEVIRVWDTRQNPDNLKNVGDVN